MALVTVLLTLLFLLSNTSANSLQLACPRNSFRTITNSDVASFGTLGDVPGSLQPCSIYNLLTDSACTFWCASNAPYAILIHFWYPVILEGLTTAGDINGYVSDFYVYSAANLSAPSELVERVTVNTVDGHTQLFAHPVYTQVLILHINEALVPHNTYYYYWHLDIFGCSEKDTSIPPAPPAPNDNDSSSTVLVLDTVSRTRLAITPTTILHSPVLTTPSSSSSSECSQTAVEHTVTHTITQTIVSSFIPLCSTNIEGNSSTRQRNPNGYLWPIFAIIFVTILLVCVTVCTIVVFKTLVKRRHLNGSSTAANNNNRTRSETIMAIDNISLYDLENSNTKRYVDVSVCEEEEDDSIYSRITRPVINTLTRTRGPSLPQRPRVVLQNNGAERINEQLLPDNSDDDKLYDSI